MLSCLDFVSHAIPGRRQRMYHHLHFIAKEVQAMTDDHSRSPGQQDSLWPRLSITSSTPPWHWRCTPRKTDSGPRYNQKQCAAFLSTIRYFEGKNRSFSLIISCHTFTSLCRQSSPCLQLWKQTIYRKQNQAWTFWWRILPILLHYFSIHCTIILSPFIEGTCKKWADAFHFSSLP